MFPIVIFLIFIGLSAAYGDKTCLKDGIVGVCTELDKCQTAINDRENGNRLQICYYNNASPIVCCLDYHNSMMRPQSYNTPPTTAPSLYSYYNDVLKQQRFDNTVAQYTAPLKLITTTAPSLYSYYYDNIKQQRFDNNVAQSTEPPKFITTTEPSWHSNYYDDLKQQRFDNNVAQSTEPPKFITTTEPSWHSNYYDDLKQQRFDNNVAQSTEPPKFITTTEPSLYSYFYDALAQQRFDNNVAQSTAPPKLITTTGQQRFDNTVTQSTAPPKLITTTGQQRFDNTVTQSTAPPTLTTTTALGLYSNYFDVITQQLLDNNVTQSTAPPNLINTTAPGLYSNYFDVITPQLLDNNVTQSTAPPNLINTTAPGLYSNYFDVITQELFDNNVTQSTAPPNLINTTAQQRFENNVAEPTVPTISVATTTQRNDNMTTTAEYIPKINEHVDKVPVQNTCQVSPKTGKKAFDKCVEYHEQLVNPCERSVATTEVFRKRHCYHEVAQSLIVNGNETKLHEFSHMALLGFGEQSNDLQWMCGGSVISERFVLTAGHCIKSSSGLVNYVMVGQLKRPTPDNTDISKLYKIKRRIQHPNYKLNIGYNDIALLETETAFKLSQYLVPACLHFSDSVNNSRAIATGWGHTSFNGANSDVLLKVDLDKYETQECAAKYPVSTHLPRGFDNNTQICYGDRTGVKDTCQGDSGGPLQITSSNIDCMYVIIGVTSFGSACGFHDPGVYTRVAFFVSWIENIVWP